MKISSHSDRPFYAEHKQVEVRPGNALMSRIISPSSKSHGIGGAL